MRCNGIISSEAVNSSLAWKFGIIVEEGGWNTILQAGVSPNHCQPPKDAGDSIGGENDLKKSPCIICHGTCSTLSPHWHWLMMCFLYCRNLSLLCLNMPLCWWVMNESCAASRSHWILCLWNWDFIYSYPKKIGESNRVPLPYTIVLRTCIRWQLW